MKTSKAYDFAHQGDIEGIRGWLKENSDSINSYVDEGMTLLHIACMFGHENLMAYLLGRGALVNIEADNESRATPLHLAVAFRDEQVADRMIKVLINNGAELNSTQSGGQTPLHHAVGRKSVKLVDTLIEAGADPFLKDLTGRSAADLAKEMEKDMGSEIEGENGPIRSSLKKAFSLSFES